MVDIVELKTLGLTKSQLFIYFSDPSRAFKTGPAKALIIEHLEELDDFFPFDDS